MGTKNTPSLFDCYAKALPDEPMFHLLARDPAAPELIRIWVAIKTGNLEQALHFAGSAVSLARGNFKDFNDQHQEAYNVAAEMEDWRKLNYGKWREPANGDNL